MDLIALGWFSFVFFLTFDFNKLNFLHKSVNIFFAIGLVLLTIAVLGILLGDFPGFEMPIYLKVFWGGLAVIALILLLYSLFFPLPFTTTYIETEKANTVVDTGMYALCRHPGVIWFGLFCLFLWLASGKMIMLWAGITWTLMDILLVYVEDRWIFPRILKGYEQYKMCVPFLIPNSSSVKRCISSLHGRNGVNG